VDVLAHSIRLPGRASVSLFSRLVAAWTYCFSQPAAERSVDLAVKRRRPRRILEIGLDDGRRAQRVITLAKRYHADCELHYTGIDLFEDRDVAQLPLPLKHAYRQLRSTGARIRLVPGDTYAALARTANSLAQVELVLISQEIARESLASAWFYLPRTLAKDAVILWADGSLPEGEYREVSRAELLAAARPARRRAA